MNRSVLVHLAAGVGNIVLATPLLVALEELGLATTVALAADYPETTDLLQPWSAVDEVSTWTSVHCGPARFSRVIPAIPPFYWRKFGSRISGGDKVVPRPSDALFYDNEQEYYLSFARKLGYPANRHPLPTLPISANENQGVTRRTVVLAPGCKTGEMAMKRWPHFAPLAERFEDVAVVGTLDDLRQPNGTLLSFPRHVRLFVGKLTLRETAELMAAAGVVVANDSGLSHVAAAVGTPTLMLFGPTPHQSLGPFPPNVQVLRRGMSCEPCWFHARFRACAHRIDCLRELNLDRVVAGIRALNSNVTTHEPRPSAHQGKDPNAKIQDPNKLQSPKLQWES
jgi:ADP-heptose:LPS heptosyltransferase